MIKFFILLILAILRKFVNCTICNKPRCIFSKSALSDEEKTSLEILLDNVIYICRSPIISETHNLHEKVYIRQKIYCNSPVEAVYYSCRRLKTEVICFYCEEKDGLLESDDTLKKNLQLYILFFKLVKAKDIIGQQEEKLKLDKKNKRDQFY